MSAKIEKVAQRHPVCLVWRERWLGFTKRHVMYYVSRRNLPGRMEVRWRITKVKIAVYPEN